MISEALRLYVEGGRVCHSLVHVCSWQGYGGLAGDRDGGGGWYACGAKPGGVGHMLGDAGAFLECQVMH